MKKTRVLSIALAAILTVAAVPAVSAASDRLIITQATNVAASTPVSQKAPATSKEILTQDEAIKIALDKVPGILKSIELDIEDNGSLDYQAEIHYNGTEYDLEFSATDGTIYKNSQDRIDWEEGIPSGSYITWAQAREAALKEVENGYVSKLELKNLYNTGVVYEAQVWLGDYEYDLILDADDGTLIRKTYERDSDASYYNQYLRETPVSTTPSTSTTSTPTTSTPTVSKPSTSTSSKPSTSQTTSSSNLISREKAEEIALAQVSGGIVTGIDFDYEHGYSIYEIEVRSGNWEYSFEIDASNGNILKTERDYEDDWYDFD